MLRRQRQNDEHDDERQAEQQQLVDNAKLAVEGR